MAYRDFEEGRSGAVGPFNLKTGEALRDWESGYKIRLVEENRQARREEKERERERVAKEREDEDASLDEQIEASRNELQDFYEFGTTREVKIEKLPEPKLEIFWEFLERTPKVLWFFVSISTVMLFGEPTTANKFIVLTTFPIFILWILFFLISSKPQHPIPQETANGFKWSYCNIQNCKCRNPQICLGLECKCGQPKACKVGQNCTCNFPKVCTNPKCGCSRPKVATPENSKKI